jgi:hypothetical protein
MEVLIYMLITLSLFFLGLSLGAIIENKRIRLIDRLDDLERTTQEILLPLADKITHIDARHRTPSEVSNGTWIDYELSDPDETMELPKIETRGKHGEGEETW